MLSVIKILEIPLAVEIRVERKNHNESCFRTFDDILDGKRKYFSVAGGYMINFLVGAYVAVGNMIPYLASYLTASEMGFVITSCTEDVEYRFQSNTSLCNWLLAAFTIGYAGFGAFGGLMQLYCSTRVVATLGCSLVITSYFITSFYTDNVYVQLCCGFGVLYGIGSGIMWSPSIVCVIQWFPHNKSLVTGVLMSALGVGAICLSVTETMYINPSNLEYDPSCGYTRYPSVMTKIPSTFLLLMGIGIVCALCGYLFLFDKPTVIETMESDDEQSQQTYGRHDEESSGECKAFVDCDRDQQSFENVDDFEIDDISEPMNYTVSEAIRTVQFWSICANVLFGVFALAFVYSDWKLFALEYLLIEDDSFLLSLNIAAAMSGFIGRFVWGGLCDFTGSYGKTMMIVTGFECIAISTLPLCPVGNKVMAFGWICVLWFCVSAAYTLFPPAISNQFGNKYCGVLTGFVMISEIIATLSQSGYFTLLQSVDMGGRERWILLCVEQAAFVGVSFIISMRFRDTSRCDKYKGLE